MQERRRLQEIKLKTSIVILNWNGEGFLRKYLPSVVESVRGIDDVEVVVADNASQDASLDLLEKEFTEVRTIVLDRNYGFAKGYNKALNQLESEYFVLLNSDIEVPDDWFPPLQEWMELHEDCGICGPKLMQMDNRDCFEYAGAAGGYLDRFGFPFCRGRVLNMTEKDEGQYDIPSEVLWVSGAALMVRSSVYFKMGGLCDEFFAHMEEIDFCWRARLQGWKVNMVPRSRVFHLGGGSLPQDSPHKLYLNYRNNLLMLSRNLPKTLAIDYAFNIAGKSASADDGPDMFLNCTDIFNENGKKMQKEWAEVTAMLGMNRAGRMIRIRMFLDILASFAYLLKGKASYSGAVFRAHRDFRRMRKKQSVRKLRSYMASILDGSRLDIARVILTDRPCSENFMSDTFALKGMWRRMEVWQAFLKKEKIFCHIRNNME